jgi:hypothetical protein
VRQRQRRRVAVELVKLPVAVKTASNRTAVPAAARFDEFSGLRREGATATDSRFHVRSVGVV